MNNNILALGTAQFGMNYGINNKTGIVPKEDIYRVLDLAHSANIDILDTSYSYGSSEERIGGYLKRNGSHFKIISKLPNCSINDVENFFLETTKRLNINSLYGYLFHSFETYKNDSNIWDNIKRLKDCGKVEKIGFSLYYPIELEYLLEKKIQINLIQVPFSIFDRRFESYFEELKSLGIEIHIRSVFLQGLVFKKNNELIEKFNKIKSKLIELNSLSRNLNISISDLCLNFVRQNRFIDKIIVGIDNVDNLKQIIMSERTFSKVKEIFDYMCHFREDDEKIIIPTNWQQSEKSLSQD